MNRHPVVIVGGGPVGLTLALDLAWRGVASLVLEQRIDIDPNRPRAKSVNVRSMEHFRRLGLARTIRERAPIAATWSQRAVVCTSLDGLELASFDGAWGIRGQRDELFAECGQQITQPLLETILREAAQDHPLVTLELGARVDRVQESTRAVAVQFHDATGAAVRVEGEYIVGADGAGGVTRQSAGIQMDRGVQLPTNVNITFRARDLDAASSLPTALHYWIVNAQTQGVLIRLDPTETWSATLAGVTDPAAFEPTDLISRLTGFAVDAEILATDVWTARMAVADDYATKRVFLAGDAAHLNPPWGGHGFNTGLGDAVNLAWKLAATLNGWGGTELLASYGPERRRVAEQTIAIATANMRAISSNVTDALASDPTLEADSADDIREEVRRSKDSEFRSLGLVLGYSYFDSPIVISDGERAAFDPVDYTPVTVPGARLPHSWIADGASVFDLLGEGFTLFADPTASIAEEFVEAAAERAVPLVVNQNTGGPALLVRSDGHIAWRGSTGDAGRIIDIARGADGATDQ